MDVFKASNSNELANSPVNRFVRRPLRTIEEDSPIQNVSSKIDWDSRSTPVRLKEESLKRQRPIQKPDSKSKNLIKRYKSSPSVLTKKYDSDEDSDEKNKRLENFRQTLMGLIDTTTVKPRNLMENLDQSLNDSICGPLLNNADDEKEDVEVDCDEIARIEAEVLAEDLKKQQTKQAAVVNSNEEDEDDLFARLEKEALETIKQEETIQASSQESFDFEPPLACSTQITQAAIKIIKPPVALVKELPKISPDEQLRLKIERNKQEAMRRRQIFLEKQRKLKQTNAIKK